MTDGERTVDEKSKREKEGVMVRMDSSNGQKGDQGIRALADSRITLAGNCKVVYQVRVSGKTETQESDSHLSPVARLIKGFRGGSGYQNFI